MLYRHPGQCSYDGTMFSKTTTACQAPHLHAGGGTDRGVLLQVVVVLSGSMEPAFYRGDILFLYMGRKPFSAGEVVVFNINGRDIPIVHRIIKVHEKIPGSKRDDDVRILTKVSHHCLLVTFSSVHVCLAKCVYALQDVPGQPWGGGPQRLWDGRRGCQG